MAIKRKEDIVTLIKSLSKSEKRYFKLYIAKNSIGESNHYIKLYDLIEKAGSVEKEVIRKLYRDDHFMQKQFKVCKYRLYEHLLNSLCAYHAESSAEDQIMQFLRKAKVLFDKTLYAQTGSILEKAKRLAIKHEKFPLIIEIIQWQKEIIMIWSIKRTTREKDITQLSEEEKSIRHKIANINEYWRFEAKLFLSYLTNGEARTPEDIDRYTAIINAGILKGEEHAESYQAKKIFYYIYTLYFITVNNLKGAYTYAKKQVDLMESQPHQIENDPARYIRALHNLVFVLGNSKKYKELFNLLQKFKSILIRFKSDMNENISSSILLDVYHIEFTAYINIGQFTKALHLLLENQDIYKAQQTVDEQKKLIFIYNVSMLYFGKGDYAQALTNINRILNNEHAQRRQDLYCNVKIFQLIVHFEKGNIDLLPYLVRSVYRFLMQKKKLYKAERVLIYFMQTKYKTTKNIKDQLDAFKVLKAELLSVCNDPQEARFLEWFDIISWLESKIENRTFEEIVREKSGYVLEERDL